MPSHFVRSLATIDLNKADSGELGILRESFDLMFEGRFATFEIDADLDSLAGSDDQESLVLLELYERKALSLTLLWELWSNETFEDDEGWRREYEAWWAGVCEAAERADIPLGNRSSEHSQEAVGAKLSKPGGM